MVLDFLINQSIIIALKESSIKMQYDSNSKTP